MHVLPHPTDLDPSARIGGAIDGPLRLSAPVERLPPGINTRHGNRNLRVPTRDTRSLQSPQPFDRDNGFSFDGSVVSAKNSRRILQAPAIDNSKSRNAEPGITCCSGWNAEHGNAIKIGRYTILDLEQLKIVGYGPWVGSLSINGESHKQPPGIPERFGPSWNGELDPVSASTGSAGGDGAIFFQVHRNGDRLHQAGGFGETVASADLDVSVHVGIVGKSRLQTYLSGQGRKSPPDHGRFFGTHPPLY